MDATDYSPLKYTCNQILKIIIKIAIFALANLCFVLPRVVQLQLLLINHLLFHSRRSFPLYVVLRRRNNWIGIIFNLS